MKKISLYILFIVGFTFVNFAQKDCFPKTRDKVFVYDEANILDATQKNSLNQKITK